MRNVGSVYVHASGAFLHTVGTYSLGNLLVVYEINKQVFK